MNLYYSSRATLVHDMSCRLFEENNKGNNKPDFIPKLGFRILISQRVLNEMGIVFYPLFLF